MLQRWRQATTLPCSTVLLMAGQPCQATKGKGIRVGLGVVRRCRQLTNVLPQDIEYTSSSGSGAVAAARPLRPPSRTRAGTTVQQPAYAAAASVTSLAAVGFATYHLLSTVELPPLDIAAAAAGRACSCVGAVVASGLLLAKLILGDRFHVQLHRGRLYVQAGVPSQGPALDTLAALETRPTGDARGNGAFALVRIPAGTHIADYRGEWLDTAAFFARYPDGVGDYAMAVDTDWIIDAAAAAPDCSAFHPVHMNHSKVRANVARYYDRAAGRVAFFASCDIAPGDELLYDYGRAYWRGREHLELP